MIVNDKGDMMIKWIHKVVDNLTQIFQGFVHEFRDAQMKFIINYAPTWLNIFGRIEIIIDLY